MTILILYIIVLLEQNLLLLQDYKREPVYF